MTENSDLVQKYGEPLRFDRNFQGPRQRNRSCTDIPCLLLFLLFIAGWVFIGYYAVRNGDLNKLTAPTDMYNHKCGIDSNVLDKKHLFFFNFTECIDPLVSLNGCQTPQICVANCPREDFSWDQMKNRLNFRELKRLLICITDEEKARLNNVNDIERAINENRCARDYTRSKPFLNRCMFEFSEDVCRFIPKQLLQRTRRNLLYGNANQTKELPFQSAALIRQEPIIVASQKVGGDRQVTAGNNGQCSEEQINGVIIKEKMMQTDTRLAKMVGNVIAHFGNSTHDAQRLGEEIVEDLRNSISVVLFALLFTMIASLVFISLMRWLASPILWLSIFGVIAGLGCGIYYSYAQYSFWKMTATVPLHELNLLKQLQNLIRDKRTWLALTILLSVLLLVIVLLVIVLRKRIKIAIALTKEGSKAVSTVISTVFFPIFSWVLYIGAIAFGIIVGLYLSSIGDNTYRMVRRIYDDGTVSNEQCVCVNRAINYTDGAACDPHIFQEFCHIYQTTSKCVETTCSFVEIENPPLVRWAIVYNIFGFLWLSFFISGFSYMVLAATFARWYWTYKKRDVPYFTLTHAFFQTAFYHLGTVAFGSLILAICRMIRIVLEYIDAKLKKYDNSVTRAILCCMKCFFWLLESFLKFLNQNAYIMCAIHGKNFCGSAKDAFNLLMRNFLRVITLDKVTDFLFFLSKLFLTAGAGVSTYFFLANNPGVFELHHAAVPTTVVVIGAFLITSVFFGVYSTAVDTLFLCFLEDCERNEGTPEKPYFMSKQLMKILGKKNKFPQRQRRSD